ncbi:MAG: AraC family transcriptional regulator [Kiritimatiellae bacterium]|nr:AraC family transcriptional regulator [Kiritimatiellia bacterium]
MEPSREVSVRGETIGLPLLASAGFDRLLAAGGHGVHAHPTYELFAVLSGALVLEQESMSSLRMRGGNVLVIRPDVSHRPAERQVKPGTYLWIQVAAQPVSFDGSNFTPADYRAMMIVLERHAGRVHRASGDLMKHLLAYQRLLDRFALPHPPPLLVTRLRIMTCLNLLRIVEHLAETAAIREGAEADPIIQAACIFLEAHYAEPLSVPQVARYLGYDVSWFEKRFRACVGVPPGNYLQSLRVEKAKDRLCAEQAEITDIALSTGFASSQYFAHVFRKFTGLTPTQYRRSLDRQR